MNWVEFKKEKRADKIKKLQGDINELLSKETAEVDEWEMF